MCFIQFIWINTVNLIEITRLKETGFKLSRWSSEVWNVPDMKRLQLELTRQSDMQTRHIPVLYLFQCINVQTGRYANPFTFQLVAEIKIGKKPNEDIASLLKPVRFQESPWTRVLLRSLFQWLVPSLTYLHTYKIERVCDWKQKHYVSSNLCYWHVYDLVICS